MARAIQQNQSSVFAQDVHKNVERNRNREFVKSVNVSVTAAGVAPSCLFCMLRAATPQHNAGDWEGGGRALIVYLCAVCFDTVVGTVVDKMKSRSPDIQIALNCPQNSDTRKLFQI